MPHRQPSLPLLLKLHDSISEIICVIDGEGRFVYINQACYPIWGYQPAELIGVKCFDMMVPEDEERSGVLKLGDEGRSIRLNCSTPDMAENLYFYCSACAKSLAL